MYRSSTLTVGLLLTALLIGCARAGTGASVPLDYGPRFIRPTPEQLSELPQRTNDCPNMAFLFGVWARTAQPGDRDSVLVRFVVDTAGMVLPDSIQVLHTTSRALRRPAIEFFTGCRYWPGKVDGQPVSVLMQTPLHLHMPRR